MVWPEELVTALALFAAMNAGSANSLNFTARAFAWVVAAWVLALAALELARTGG